MFFITTIIIFLILLFYYYRKYKQNKFYSQGINGPKPNFLFGNLLELRSKRYDEALAEWNDKYGKVYVYFEGGAGNLVIGDPDILQEVMVRQFSNFHGRKLFPMQKNPDKEEKVSMFVARGKRWKRMRTSINPAFSEKKMRNMYPLIGICSEDFMNEIKIQVEKNPSIVIIQDLLQRLTLDIICKCAFGVDTKCQTNINHPFIVALKSFFLTQNFSSLKAAFIMTFTEFRIPLINLFAWLNKRPGDNPHLKVIREKMLEVIDLRRKGSEKRLDLLQLLLDAEVHDQKLLDEENLCPINSTDTDDDEGSDDKASKRKGKPLTTEEILQQANLFLFAGYETSSMAMSYTMYHMAENPDIQKKLQEDIDSAFDAVSNHAYDSLELYDAISKLPYLNAIIYEVLRVRPFANTVVNRTCLNSEGTYLSNGMYVPPDTAIITNAFSVHMDPEIWTDIDPKKFAPERFIETNDNGEMIFKGPPHPLAWIPFGAGPRNCIGQRFAIVVIKTNLARFFHDYSVEFSPKSQRPLELRVGATISPTESITVAIKKRH